MRRHALILDIDGTLIDSSDTATRPVWATHVDYDHVTAHGEFIKKRPGVDAFLDAAFAAGPVALWTHADECWARVMTDQVLLDAHGAARP